MARRTALMLAATATSGLSQSGRVAAGCPVIHFEIGCRNQAKTAEFFSALFNWQTQVNGPAATIETGNAKGIGGHITSLGHEPEHYTLFYVQVDDVQAYLGKVRELGGKPLVGPVRIPSGTFAWFADPDGNMIGLLKPAS